MLRLRKLGIDLLGARHAVIQNLVAEVPPSSWLNSSATATKSPTATPKSPPSPGRSTPPSAILVARIRAYRPVETVTDDTPTSVGPQSSIVAALRNRLTTKDAQIDDLKAELRQRDQIIAALRGEVENLRRLTATRSPMKLDATPQN